MKNLTKILAVAVVATMAFSSISVFAADTNESAQKCERPAFSKNMKSKEANLRGDKKAVKTELTDEEKTAKLESIKPSLAEKLEAGEITQEKYDETISSIESGNFKFHGKDSAKSKGRMPDKKEFKGEKLKASLAEKLEAGEITKEEYDEKLTKIESSDFKLDGKGGRNIRGSKRTKKSNGEINSAKTVSEA